MWGDCQRICSQKIMELGHVRRKTQVWALHFILGKAIKPSWSGPGAELGPGVPFQIWASNSMVSEHSVSSCEHIPWVTRVPGGGLPMKEMEVITVGHRGTAKERCVSLEGGIWAAHSSVYFWDFTPSSSTWNTFPSTMHPDTCQHLFQLLQTLIKSHFSVTPSLTALFKTASLPTPSTLYPLPDLFPPIALTWYTSIFY